ncbi:MAG: SusC/RagA family TonB-linked outer membrane protein [Bacteroidetes bacterium]|nr:MAG: SusC/RagA family TonB-linked outer membrane protein [Bacteroidota bacterium]
MNIKLRPNALRAILFAGLAVFAFGSTFAQTRVSGKVVTSEGEPLAGATVQVKGTTTGAFTDDAGQYSVNAASDAVLVFSYVGYEKLEEAVNGRTTINVTLSESGTTLDEVVVTGYGTQKAKEVTSAISTVKAADFNKGLVNDPTQLIQGKVAGLSIVRNGSDPNGGFTLRLRGLSTLGQNTQPLVIIDGVPNASLNTVDPNDIQSIDVLKDGSAAAIYGTQGSSGVILITTKRGIPGSSTVEYAASVTSDQIARREPVQGAADFVASGGPDYGSDTDWIGEVTRNGVSTVHNLALAGGSGATSYRVALNYRNAAGILINNGFEQLNGRVNVTQKALNNRLTITTNVSATNRDAEFGMTDALRYAVIYNPTAPVLAKDYYPAGDPLLTKYGGYFQAENFDYFNPVAIAEQHENRGTNRTLLASVKGDLEIIDGLTLSGFYSLQRGSSSNGFYSKKQSYYGNGFNRNGYASRRTDNNSNEQFDATLNYAKTFGKVNFDALAGYSFQEFFFDGLGMEGGDFLSDGLTYNSLGGSRDFQEGLGTVFSYQNTYRLISFFGRVRLNIDETYFIMASLRNDGSSRFGANNKRASFPGLSVGVNVANLVDIANVDQLKVRLGYGQTGNLPGESYRSLLLYNRVGNFYYDGNFVPAYGPSFNSNPELQWEVKTDINAGVDFSLFNNKVFGSIDYYTRNTNNLIYNVVVPVPPNQAPNTTANLEDVVLRNSGVEVSVGTKIGNDKVSWEPRVLFSTYKTVLDTTGVEDPTYSFFTSADAEQFDPSTSPGAPGQNNLPTMRVAGGEELGQIWGFKFTGVTETGDYIFEDINQDGTITEDDKTAIGNGLPDFSLGFNNTIKVGKIDFNFFLRGDFGHDLQNNYRTFYESLGSRPADNNVITKYSEQYVVKAAPQFSSLYVEDASFVTLDNASLGYSFSIAKGNTSAKGRVFVSGQNLFTITGYTGADPSIRYADSGNPLFPGINRRGTYFMSRSLSAGLNLTF